MRRQLLFTGLLAFQAFAQPATVSEAKAQDAGREEDQSIQIATDVVYGHKFGLAMTFDVYRPRESNGAGVMFINSGGWRSPIVNYLVADGDGHRLRTDAELDRINSRLRTTSFWPLLENGFAVFDVRHGSSPKFTVPEIVGDLREAIRFVRDHADDYGLNADRLGLWGGSSGGHLALLLGMRPELDSVNAPDGVQGRPAGVAAVVAFFPVTDLQRWTSGFEQRYGTETSQRFSALDFAPEEYVDYSSIHFASPDDPPTLLVHGTADPAAPIIESESMHQALLAARVESRFVRIEGAGHMFEGEDIDRALTETLRWFEEHLLRSRH
jgi:acetyl esterase/lipase